MIIMNRIQQAEITCPFNHGECGFKTDSETEYADHVQTHAPVILPHSESLEKVRVAIAKAYSEGLSKPVKYAGHLWADKPRDMDCGTMTFIIQDHGITDSDNYAGLCMANSGEVKRSKPYHNPFKGAKRN